MLSLTVSWKKKKEFKKRGYFEVLGFYSVGIDVYSNKQVFNPVLSLCTNVITFVVYILYNEHM